MEGPEMVTDKSLGTIVGSVKFKNPVIAASGTFGYGSEYSPVVNPAQFGGIVLKGTTPTPRVGNPPPRLIETPAGLVNSIGLENPGIDVVLKEKLPALDELARTNTRIILNLSADDLDGFLNMVEKCNRAKNLDILEINLSCPNLPAGGMQFGADPKMVEQISSAVKKVSTLPIWIKLAPLVTDIAVIARAAENGGACAISLINTLPALVIDVHAQRPVLGNVFGGLSGPAIMPFALRQVFMAAQAVKIPVIGIGGISSWEDTVCFLIAGAKAVQVGTAIFVEPNIGEKICSGLSDYLVQKGYSSVNEIIGKLEKAV
jgi:dihydroorotate dehydrogenase (NAD+) catalytic subunit